MFDYDVSISSLDNVLEALFVDFLAVAVSVAEWGLLALGVLVLYLYVTDDCPPSAAEVAWAERGGGRDG